LDEAAPGHLVDERHAHVVPAFAGPRKSCQSIGVPPKLVVWIGGDEWTRVHQPELGARAWALGVVAVQISVEEGRVVGQVRAHATQAPAAELRPLTSPSLVQVQLVAEGETPLAPPPIAVQELAGAAARLLVFLDEELVDSVALPPASRDGTRAFGHVFCRWLRSGGFEPGFDLTDFLMLPPGKMYERRVNRALAPGQTISYRFA
jgi:hypothetical protein